MDCYGRFVLPWWAHGPRPRFCREECHVHGDRSQLHRSKGHLQYFELRREDHPTKCHGMQRRVHRQQTGFVACRAVSVETSPKALGVLGHVLPKARDCCGHPIKGPGVLRKVAKEADSDDSQSAEGGVGIHPHNFVVFLESLLPVVCVACCSQCVPQFLCCQCFLVFSLAHYLWCNISRRDWLESSLKRTHHLSCLCAEKIAQKSLQFLF